MARIMEASTNGEEGQLGSIRCQDLKYEEDTRQEDRGGLRAEDLNRSALFLLLIIQTLIECISPYRKPLRSSFREKSKLQRYYNLQSNCYLDNVTIKILRELT